MKYRQKGSNHTFVIMFELISLYPGTSDFPTWFTLYGTSVVVKELINHIQACLIYTKYKNRRFRL